MILIQRKRFIVQIVKENTKAKMFSPTEIDTNSTFDKSEWECDEEEAKVPAPLKRMAESHALVLHRVGVLFERYLERYRKKTKIRNVELRGLRVKVPNNFEAWVFEMIRMMHSDWKKQQLTDREFAFLVDQTMCW